MGLRAYYLDGELNNPHGPEIIRDAQAWLAYLETFRPRMYEEEKDERIPVECWVIKNGQQFHRIGGPAKTYEDGSMEYYENNKHHRLDGPAIILAEGVQEYRIRGKKHRADGPAVINTNPKSPRSTVQEYWLRVKRHRTDGPAVIRANGKVEFWLEGEKVEEADLRIRNQ